MPNCLAKKCAISLQSFANGCIACNGEFPFPAPGPVDLPALCAVPGIAQKRQKNAEGLGRRSAFFMGVGADRRGSGQRSGPTPRRVGRQLTPAKRHAQNGKLGQKTAVDIKKRRGFPAFFIGLAPWPSVPRDA